MTYDSTSPVITLTSPEPHPGIIPVKETPYPVTGTVTERNLAGVSLNSKNFYLLPMEQDTWLFEGNASLVRGQDYPVIIEAWDHAGNRTACDLTLRLDSALEIEVITPKQGEELVTNKATTDVDITVRVPGIAGNDTVRAGIGGAGTAMLNLSGETARGTVTVGASDGEHRLTVQAVSAAGEVLGGPLSVLL